MTDWHEDAAEAWFRQCKAFPSIRCPVTLANWFRNWSKSAPALQDEVERLRTALERAKILLTHMASCECHCDEYGNICERCDAKRILAALAGKEATNV